MAYSKSRAWRGQTRAMNGGVCRTGILGVATAAGLMLTGAALAQQTPPKAGGTVIIGMTEPVNVNPDLSTNYPNQLVGCMIYEGLVQVSRDATIEPLLAESWNVSEDGKTYSFKLKKTNWQDGKPFTSADVKFTIEKISSKFAPVFASAASVISGIETPDERTVIFKLKESFGPFLMSLACPQGGAIMPAHLFHGSENDPAKNAASSTAPVGTGPFKLTEWKRGDFLRLQANRDYHVKDRPYLREVIIRHIPQATSRLQALRASEIDFVPGYFVPPSDYGVVSGTKGLKLENSGFAPGAKMLFLNTTVEPLNRKEVRHALMRATDRAFLYKNVWFNTGGIGRMPFTSKIEWAADKEIDYATQYPFDIEAAKTALDKANLPVGADGTRFKLTFVYNPEYGDVAQAAQAIKSMWSQVGVDVRLIAVEGSAYGERIFTQKNYDMTMIGYTSYGDPALGVARIFVSGAIGQPFGNASLYSNSGVDDLFQRGRSASDLKQRGIFYKQVQKILADELPVLTLQEYQHEDAARSALKDVWGGQGYGRWSNAWLDE
ncbi:ABC transporter substrate-binding protein [Hyphomicrobiales bacterium]|nr:ABC transporter substrate-binding protein [Hyphomicrobiales bacterium]CAH1676919.1 ABC transporter substrate-binding protein [Hyphomicrobiales bacterium]